MTVLGSKPLPNVWLERFHAEPAAALDDLLRGLTRIPPYERATPSEILKRLFGMLPADHSDLRLLDETLCAWLDTRWQSGSASSREAYGLPRFVTEVMDGLAAVWLLGLPRCGRWLQDNYLAIARWAAPMRLSKAWDLPRASANAAALTQTDARLRLYWFRLCEEATRPSQRAMIDPALTGLSNLPGCAGHGASKELIAGLARFGAGLTSTPVDQLVFLRRWRALKVRFPRIPKTWQKLWHPALSDSRYEDKPFRKWLLESDPALGRPVSWAPGVRLPTRAELLAIVNRINSGERETALADARKLLEEYEHYAEGTGDAFYFVLSACNLAGRVLAWAPGHALAWAREAQRWSPSEQGAWSLRAQALVRLDRKDLARAVLWEGTRRFPEGGFARTQLALLLFETGNVAEAEALLREAVAVDRDNPGARVELARLLNHADRREEAEELLRRSIDELPENPVILYTLANLLLSWERPTEAMVIRNLYLRQVGADSHTSALDRVLAAGPAGPALSRKFLTQRRFGVEDSALAVSADSSLAKSEVADEVRDSGLLQRAATVGHADLLFRLGSTSNARTELAKALREDDDDPYARVVWALHDPARRPDLAGRYRGSFGVLAPHLAAAGPETPEGLWNRLRDEFPERRVLTDLARLIRGGLDEATAERVGTWIREGSESEDGYLRHRLRLLLGRDGSFSTDSPDQRELLNTAIRREVEIGDFGLEQAA